MAIIKFGTSGWRAIIADDFTFANVRLATEAIGRYVKRRNSSPVLLVGYDTRFASEHFGREAARVLSSQNIRARLCSQAVPTPAVAFTIVHDKLDGAINITASHNPGEYNGLKFSTSDGASALPEVTSEIEKEIVQLQRSNWEFPAKPNDALIESVDIGPAYLRDLATKIDFKKIRTANLGLAYDALHGTLLQQRMSVFYNAQCCGIALEYQNFNFGGVSGFAVPADHRFFVSFTLAGLGNFFVLAL